MALNQAIRDSAGVLAERIAGGQGAARTSLGGGGEAFGWAGGMVPTIADFATVRPVKGMSFQHTLVSESGTPAGPVSPGEQKPNATTLTSGETPLVKFAGLATWQLEQSIQADGLAGAIASVISRSLLKSFEADAVAKLALAASGPVTGADWVAAVAIAQASVIAQGGSPSVLVLSAADYGQFVNDVTNVNGFSTSPDSAVGALLGSPIHVSSGLAAGKAYIFDSSAVVVGQQEDGLLATLDTVSLAATNQARLVLDLIAGTLVVDPSFVVEITAPTPPA